MQSPEPLLSKLVVNDPDLLVTGVRGASLQPCQLSARVTPSKLARLVLPTTCLDMVHLGPAMLFSGEMPRDCYTVMFVLTCPKHGRSFNFSKDHLDGYVGFWPPGGTLDASTPEDYSNATLTVPSSTFHAAVARDYPEIPKSVLANGAGVRVGHAAQEKMRSLLAMIEDAIWRGESLRLTDTFEVQQLESALLDAFLSALRSGCTEDGPPMFRTGGRLRRFRQVRDFIADRLHQPLYLNDLCDELDLSRRGVENMFNDLLGINPITYLRHQRLHGVRRALTSAEPALGVVKEKALQWGFRHLGRFSREYFEFFGESPRETLARSGRG